MKKLLAITIVYSLFMSFVLASTKKTDYCSGACGETELTSQAVPTKGYGWFEFQGVFTYYCYTDGNEGCQFSAELKIYQSTNNPMSPWAVYYDYWWNQGDEQSMLTQCGTADQKNWAFSPVYLTPGYSYLIEINTFAGSLNDAQEGLIDPCSTASLNELVPQRTGP